MIRRWASSDANFARDLKALLHVDAAQDDSIERAVAEILARVRSEGDAAVLEYTQRFDAYARHPSKYAEKPSIQEYCL